MKLFAVYVLSKGKSRLAWAGGRPMLYPRRGMAVDEARRGLCPGFRYEIVCVRLARLPGAAP